MRVLIKLIPVIVLMILLTAQVMILFISMFMIMSSPCYLIHHYLAARLWEFLKAVAQTFE